ncbi:MAG: putative inorganic carbon transporter subunit DabA, partial [Limnobacter sp.]|nr:putative inorganic carbon transporter subunit DabA [Limnobacter sp.]
EVNARVLANLLNDAQVQKGLAEKGFNWANKPRFVAALHNTTTDEFEWYDLDLQPHETRGKLEDLKVQIEQACDLVRRERAPALGLSADLPSQQLFRRLRQRANDGAQTRPEWGLAGNASFLIGPRWRSQQLNLKGRTFLQDYNSAQDTDGSLLELLMTAPMLVTHWINWQYHASTVDPKRLGSGNKLLHNVVGGHLGVFEGNGGDLRIGLAEQSVHDGKDFVHEPLRLTVVIDAPRKAIDAILAKHEVVRQLVSNHWLYLWRFEGEQLEQHRAGAWVRL